jgi:outer membrane protein OmpA-like peptidoglycan-associated protein
VTSPLRELDAACNTLLPADLQYHIAGRRGPGPNTAASALRPPPQPGAVQTPTPPYQARTFTLAYDFDSEVAGKTIGEALKAVNYARASNARQIRIVGYRAATLLSDGTLAEEIPDIGVLRAKELAAAIRKLGIPATTTLTQRGSSEPEPADGVSDPGRRRAEITVEP